MITLYPHQSEAVNYILNSWVFGRKSVLAVIPTGGGKTYVKGDVARKIANQGGLVLVFAHRDVLLSQISIAMADLGVEHSFIAAPKTIRTITDLHVEKHGRSFYNDRSRIIVTSVDSYTARMRSGRLGKLPEMVTHWLMDEAHHALKDNKWGRCISSLTNAVGAGVTATPKRSDKKGLGVHADGVFEDMKVCITTGELINIGRLSPYKIYVPPQKLDVSDLRVTASGDVNQNELAKRTDKPEITGDAVEHYIRISYGKQAICFTVNIEHANHVAEEFKKAGISAASVSSKTPIKEREELINKFKAGSIMVLVNCDLFGEGFDVPAVHTVIMLRYTKSYSLFKQQFGRMLRVCEGKEYGILIDHVGNVIEHCTNGEPHEDPEWTLDRETKRSFEKDEEIDRYRTCPSCFARYLPSSRGRYVCPECNHQETKEEESQARLELAKRDGTLVEMNIDSMNRLLEKKRKVDRSVDQLKYAMANAPQVVRNSAIKKHVERQTAQNVLRCEIQKWCETIADVTGWFPDAVKAEFTSVFKKTILECHVLAAKEARELASKIRIDRIRRTQ